MARLGPVEIAMHAARAGWRGQDLAIAVAVALGESGGVTDAKGDTGITTSKWGPSIGLWQIRSLNAQKGTGGVRDELANVDPATNAEHAYQIWKDAGGWSPWTVYTSGKYLIHMGQAGAAVATKGVRDIAGAAVGGVGGAVGGAIAGEVKDTAGALLAVAQEPLRFLTWLKDPNNIQRVVAVVVGANVLLAGLIIVAYGALPGSVKSAAGVGKVTKLTGGK